MGSGYTRVRARVYSLAPEEGSRSRNVDLRNPRSPYELLADVGLGNTEEGFPMRCIRKKYDAAKTLAIFSAKLRDETDLDSLSDDRLTVVRETMQPTHVSLWLRSSDGIGVGER